MDTWEDSRAIFPLRLREKKININGQSDVFETNESRFLGVERIAERNKSRNLLKIIGYEAEVDSSI